MQLLERDPYWMYSLYRSEEGELYIETVCGSVGLYDIWLRLTDDDVEKYQSNRRYARELVHAICTGRRVRETSSIAPKRIGSSTKS
jgi:hypothetical protein